MNKLLEYLKKKWLGLLYIGLLFVLLVFLIPGQKKSYLREDWDAIENRSWLITFIIAGALILIAGVFFLRKLNLSGFTSLIVTSIWIFSFAFFVFSPLVRFSILAANKIGKNELFEKTYIVEPIGESKPFLLFLDANTKEPADVDDRIKIDTGSFYKKDTITVLFRKGLFGYKYLVSDPAIKKK